MSLTRETMEELMQYADGELDAGGRARVEALLETSDEARGVVDALGALGDVVRDGAEARAAQSAAGDEIAEAVMRAIETGVRAAGRGDVVPLAKARRSRAGMASAVVAALALAAGVLLFVTGRAPTAGPKEEVFGSAAPQLPASPEAEASSGDPEALAQVQAPGVDLEEVRSVRNKVNVFFTPAVDSARTSVVVWIDDRHGGP